MTTLAALVKKIETKMSYVEGGNFNMGSKETGREQPIHQVEISSFYMSCYPTTNEQFVPFLNARDNQAEKGINWVNLEGNYSGVKCGIRKTADGFECITGLEKHPMIYVNWDGARAYCEWLSAQTGQAYRLPSESEWEYAARGGRHQNDFSYAGSNDLNEVGWYKQNSHGQTKPVGLKFSNELGLYDMSGNVWEWCADHWHENYKGAPKDGSAWLTGGDSTRRVVRGGSWVDNDYYCRVSYRDWGNAGSRDDTVGFRVARY